MGRKGVRQLAKRHKGNEELSFGTFFAFARSS